MRPFSPTAVSRLRSAFAPPTSPRQGQTPCFSCAHRICSQPSSRRQQSNSATQNREDINVIPQTHYTFFPKSLPAGPPPTGGFSVDLTALKREFLQLQARAHPDLHPPEDKNRAQALSARINEAYKTLSSPLLRAQYLLSLRGIEVAEDETAKVDDAELLMEVLETREHIEEAESEEDLVELKIDNDERVEQSVKTLEKAFQDDDVDLAKTEAVKLRYWINIRESLDAWEKGKPVVLVH